MTTEEIKKDYFYYCSFEFQDASVQMWINKKDDSVIFYEKGTGFDFMLSWRQINTLNILASEVNNYFVNRYLRGREEKE